MPEQKHYVHETSCVDNDVVIGEGTKIWHFCHIQGGARIGRHCVLGQNVHIGTVSYTHLTLPTIYSV